MRFKLETKFSQMIKGLAVQSRIKFLIEIFNVNILKSVIEKIVSCGPIVGVVIFQPEIRSCLQYLGRKMHVKKKKNVNATKLFSIKKAVEYMSKQRIGALITFERNMDLKEFIETGTLLNADVTGDLTINIFTPNTPLHDGAVIIRNRKIVAASCYLPLTKSEGVPSRYGTRHRAALGMSEVNDSITVVVSEETGEIGIAVEGVFLDRLTPDMCMEMVRRELTWI